ncbi:hypothetical protein [Flavobacterium sp. HJJ]
MGGLAGLLIYVVENVLHSFIL